MGVRVISLIKIDFNSYEIVFEIFHFRESSVDTIDNNSEGIGTVTSSFAVERRKMVFEEATLNGLPIPKLQR